MNSISIYIHIPFCIAKCNYCSFNSYKISNFSFDFVKKYFETLRYEIELKRNIISNRKITSIYFGGGTPSLIKPEFLKNILNNIQVNNDIEITLEANPKTINDEKLEEFKTIGINRISIGIQTINKNLLKVLGRVYEPEDAVNSLKLIKKYFNNFSIDLMFGIPQQTIKDLERDIKFIKEVSPRHISCYLLSVEEGTIFYKNNIKEIEEETFVKMYDFLVLNLEKAGYLQYEISNFALNGFESIHNLNYWNYGEYIGLGAGAVSFINHKRLTNRLEPIDYIKNVSNPFVENLTEKEMINEYIFLNLRKKDGLDLDKFYKKFKFDFMEKFYKIIQLFTEEELIKKEKNKIFLTKKGFKISNEIFAKLWI